MFLKAPSRRNYSSSWDDIKIDSGLIQSPSLKKLYDYDCLEIKNENSLDQKSGDSFSSFDQDHDEEQKKPLEKNKHSMVEFDQKSDNSKGSGKSKGSPRSSRHMQLQKNNLKMKKPNGNSLLSPPDVMPPIQFQMHPQCDEPSIETEFPDPEHPHINTLKDYLKVFGKQEFFFFGDRKGQPPLMRMSTDPRWAHPVLEKHLLEQANARDQQAKAEMEKNKMRHRQMVMDIIQQIVCKADTIPMQKETFMQNLLIQEQQQEESKYQEIEKNKKQQYVKKMSLIRISQMQEEESKKLPQQNIPDSSPPIQPVALEKNLLKLPGQVGDQISDSENSDYPEVTSKQEQENKRSIGQPEISKQISQKIQENKDDFLRVEQGIIIENIDDSDEEKNFSQIPADQVMSSLSFPGEQDINSLIKKLSERIPGIKPIDSSDTSQQLMELSIQLLQRNKQLEKEKVNIKEDIRKIVQKQGHLVLRSFNSFGQSDQLQSKSSIIEDDLEASRDNIQKQIIDLTQQLEMMAQQGSSIQDKNLALFKSQQISSQNLNEGTIKKFQSQDAQRQAQVDNNKQEQLKSLKETLEQTKLNKELITYIQDKLNSLMIDFNQGFILSLTIKEKQDLKKMIDQIDAKNHEQNSNVQQVQTTTNTNRVLKCKPKRSLSLDLSIIVSPRENRSEYQIQSDNLQKEYLEKAFEDQLYVQETSNMVKCDSADDTSQCSSQQTYNQLKEAQKTDYSFYFQMKNGIFITQTQMHFSNLVKFRKKNDLVAFLTNQPHFAGNLKDQLKQDWSFRKKQTLVIDVESVFLAKIDLNDEEDVQKLTSCKDLDRNFVVLVKEGHDPQICSGGGCSQKSIQGFCCCNLKVYNIRPHTFEIICAIRPFFEMVAISKLPFKEVKHIIEHLEKILNKSIIEKNKKTTDKVIEMKRQQKRYKDEEKRDRIGRFKPKLIKLQLYFQYMICQRNYTYVQELGEHIENLHILTMNRDREKIYTLTSNQIRLISAMVQGFCGIPVLKYQKFDNHDFQLKILETYLIKLQYQKDTKSKNINDFGILTQKQNSKTLPDCIYKREQVQPSEDDCSDDSFNPRSNSSLSNSVGDSAFKKREQLGLFAEEIKEPEPQSQNSSEMVKMIDKQIILVMPKTKSKKWKIGRKKATKKKVNKK